MNKLLHTSRLFIKRNSSTILTCVGAVGVVGTAVAAVKATPKALRLLEQAETEKGEKLTKFEVVRVAGPAYIPAAVIGGSTIACIVGANVLNKRTQAGLMSAYALLDSSYKEYKNKVIDLYGEEGNKKVIAEIAKDKYEENEVEIDPDKQLFYDDFSGRYFNSSFSEVQRAEYLLTRDLTMQDFICLSSFYDYLGLEPIDGGDEIGWSTTEMMATYWHSWIDFHHEKVVMEDGLECYIITMPTEPTADYLDY